MLAAVTAPEAGTGLDRLRAPQQDLGTVVEHDRRARTERIIELGRWMVLIFAAVSANLPSPATRDISSVNLLLSGWALFNLAVTLSLVAGHLPGRRTGWAMTALDIAVATELVYMTGGVESSFGVTFYAVIVASSLRYGIRGSLACALAVSMLNVAAGVLVAHGVQRNVVEVYVSRLFLYVLIALTSGFLTRELVASRARQMARTFELEHAAFFELREVDRLKSEFIMLASHELRTPLAKIKAWLSLMQEAGDRLPATAHREGLEVLRGEAEHLARLTDNLLCIAQLEAGEIRLKTAPTHLATVVDEAIARFVETADRRRFQLAIDKDAMAVLADRERLILAIACLIDNALKFSPEADPVRIAAERSNGTVRIEVTDNGRHIPAEQRELVFASFYQMESPMTRQRGGCGVGLYLARQLITRMGGRVWVDNRRARGNTFAVTLPAP